MQREFSRSSLLHAAVPSGLLGRVCTAGRPLSVNFAQGRVVLRGREVSVARIEKGLLNVFLTHETIPNQAICLPGVEWSPHSANRLVAASRI